MPIRAAYRPMASALWSAILAAALALAPPAHADTDDWGVNYALPTVTVVAMGVSNSAAASAGDVSQEQLASEPLLRPGAVLENVPGLIVTQHSGEGKANQYFLRAFNLDHGTDLATEVDGMPVNMPTHAHGQGYTDLNFVIPELLADLHYKKGPYYADEGDFATAGAVRMDLLSETAARASAGYGEDGYRRGLLIGSTPLGSGTLLGAGEVYHNDGPFDIPDDYDRLNGVLRYRNGNDRDFWAITAMAYSGRWNATDQVPERAIAAGLIDRFGSLNPTDGGESHRSSLSFNRVRRSDTDQVQLSAYVIRYRLDLWSTFTYYLKDPTYGDQMLQHDDRVVYGFSTSKTWFTTLAGLPMTNVIGLQGRVDDIRDVAIHPTYERQIIGTTQDAAVTESNAALFAENTIEWRPWLRSTLALREDGFDFDVRDKMRNADGSCNLQSDPLGCNTGTRRAAIANPKLAIVLGPWGGARYFLDVADGYHSNDARGVTRSGQNAADQPVTPLTRATSAELGASATITPDWQTSLDVFLLKLQSELVFDGDAGVTAPSGATTRSGVEWSSSYRLNRWVSADLDAAFTRGRFDHDVPADDLGCGGAASSHPCAVPLAITGRYIPNSPTNVVSAGVTAESPWGLFGAVRARHFGESPLVEDNSARSPAYTTIDLQLGYRPSAQWLVALEVFNAFNVRWNDIEYYYVSRLQYEASPQADTVVHPGVPRTLRARIEYRL
jgi:hypothetical protein